MTTELVLGKEYRYNIGVMRTAKLRFMGINYLILIVVILLLLKLLQVI